MALVSAVVDEIDLVKLKENPHQVVGPHSSVKIAILSTLYLIAHPYCHLRIHMVTTTMEMVATITAATQRGNTFDRMGASSTGARPEAR